MSTDEFYYEIAELKDENPEFRKRAAKSLALNFLPYPTHPIAKELLALLKHSDPVIVMGAVDACSEAYLRGGIDLLSLVEKALPTIADVLRYAHADPFIEDKIRNSAVETLGLVGRAYAKVDYSSLIPKFLTALPSARGHLVENIVKLLAFVKEYRANIDEVIPVLIAGLRDANPGTRYGSAIAMKAATEHGLDITKALPDLIKNISDDDSVVAGMAILAVGKAARSGRYSYDISQALELLMKKLSSHPQEIIGQSLTYTLAGAIENEKSRAKALRMLEEAMSDPNPLLRFNAASVFTELSSIPVETEAEKKLKLCVLCTLTEPFLEAKDDRLVYHAVRYIDEATTRGWNTSPTFRYIVDFLKISDVELRQAAILFFRNAAEKKLDVSIVIPALLGLLNDEHTYVKIAALDALLSICKASDSLETVDRIRQRVMALTEEHDLRRYKGPFGLAEKCMKLLIAINRKRNELLPSYGFSSGDLPLPPQVKNRGSTYRTHRVALSH